MAVQRSSPVLHRDDPSKAPLVGHVKVTRHDWLNIARNVLVHEGVAEVKVLSLAAKLGVSRSSFYWYFSDRLDLLSSLLDEWEKRNTAQIVTHCEMTSTSITEAVCNFFRCFVDTSRFDRGLDFAVREWSRRDDTLRVRVDRADSKRIEAITGIFLYHGYDPVEADARARILYFMQLGYHALEIRESMETRMSRLDPYILGFTGRKPDTNAMNEFLSFTRTLSPS